MNWMEVQEREYLESIEPLGPLQRCYKNAEEIKELIGDRIIVDLNEMDAEDIEVKMESFDGEEFVKLDQEKEELES